MVNCSYCGEPIIFPFTCNYCQKTFCEKCRLPESHQCTNLVIVRSQRKDLYTESRVSSSDKQRNLGPFQSIRRRTSRDWFKRGSRGAGSYYGRNEPWRMIGGLTVGSEFLDILIATILIFAVLSFRNVSFTSSNDRSYMIGILLTILTGFIGHELAHRTIARRNGLEARFVLWKQGILFTLFGLILPFVFIVPGFVFMTGYTSRNVTGKVAWSGPATNILNGLVLMTILLISDITIWNINFDVALSIAAQLNFFLALFNLLPFGPLDGKKIRDWNSQLWAISLGSSLVLWTLLLF